MRILHEDFASGSAIRQAITPARGRCALVPEMVRLRHVTADFGRSRDDQRCRNPVRVLPTGDGYFAIEDASCENNCELERSFVLADAGHIVVVDDDPSLRQLVIGYLEHHSIPTKPASNRTELDRHLSATVPSLIIL